MKIEVWHDGERMAHLLGESVVIDYPGAVNHLADREGRECFRQELREFWEGYLDMPIQHIRVRFDDECPDCKQPMVNWTEASPGRCTNPNCIVNVPNAD